jgi:histone H3/H4
VIKTTRTSETRLPPGTVDRIIRSKIGDYRVSREADKEMAEILADYCEKIAANAMELAMHDNRVTLKAEDIKLAYKQLKT